MFSFDTLATFPLSQPVAIFFLVLVIILAAPTLFDRLRIPRIVGLILSGAAVGPYALNLLDYDASFRIFGEVGILYLMFMAAVEIDMYHMRKNLRSGLLSGLITFVLPMAVGVVFNRYAFNTGWDTATLMAVMYASHTLISYPIVSKFGLSANRGAIVAVCGTVVAVLLALITLAEVVDIRVSGSFRIERLALTLLSTAVYALAVGFSFPFLTRRFFRRINDSVSQFIFILAMVTLSSLLARLVGLEAIIGAFYAGLVLNRFVPSRSALMGRLSFVGNAIFIPYFLIGVGMLLNVQVLWSGWNVLAIAGAMTGIALLTKRISARLSARICSLTDDEEHLLFGLSSGKAAATIAATMIGYRYGLLSEDLMNGAVVMILICCVVAPVVTQRAAKSIRMRLRGEVLEEEAGIHPGYARQIVAVANPVTAEGLLRISAFMRSPENHEAVTLLFVRSSDDARMIADGRSAMAAAVGAATSMNLGVEEVERYDLNIVTGLTNTLKERNATEILIGLHRKSNIVDTFFGSMTERLLRSTDKMVLLSRCLMPVDTVVRIFVYVPRKAEYESGFRSWVARVANLAGQLGCKVVFMACSETSRFIEEFIREQDYPFSRTYRDMDSWDDFIILSSQISPDDLFIVVSARRDSLSHSSDIENLPAFIGRHFSRHNIMLIYPMQFGS